MLINIDDNKIITKMPHEKEFIAWCKKLSATDYQRIVDELNSRIDGNEVNTSSWIPGNDWNGTAFIEIYFACGQDVALAGMFFGLIMYKVMMDRPERWAFGRYEKDGVPIKGMTYFILP